MTAKQHLKTAEFVAIMLDSRFGVGSFRFGLAAILDLIPEFGDFIAAILSFYIIWIAIQMEVPPLQVARMVGNVSINLIFGFIPVIGDIIYLVHKANLKNLQILKDHAPDFIEGEIIE